MSTTELYVVCAIVTVVADVVAIVSIVRGSRAIRAGTDRNRRERLELLDVARRVMELANLALVEREGPLVPPGHPDASWPTSAELAGQDGDDAWGRRE